MLRLILSDEPLKSFEVSPDAEFKLEDIAQIHILGDQITIDKEEKDASFDSSW